MFFHLVATLFAKSVIVTDQINYNCTRFALIIFIIISFNYLSIWTLIFSRSKNENVLIEINAKRKDIKRCRYTVYRKYVYFMRNSKYFMRRVVFLKVRPTLTSLLSLSLSRSLCNIYLNKICFGFQYHKCLWLKTCSFNPSCWTHSITDQHDKLQVMSASLSIEITVSLSIELVCSIAEV